MSDKGKPGDLSLADARLLNIALDLMSAIQAITHAINVMAIPMKDALTPKMKEAIEEAVQRSENAQDQAMKTIKELAKTNNI